jgi:type VI protein secretion system component Hcp
MKFGSGLVKLTSAFSFLCALTPSISTAATTYYLKLDGITGGSPQVHREGWIEVDNFDWSITSVRSPVSGSAGKPTLSDFSWTQGLDKSITGLFNDITAGKHIKTAVFDIVTSGNERPVTFFEMTFGDVLLSKVDLSGASGSNKMDGSFNYANVKLDYWLINPDGTKGTGTTASYDLEHNSGSIGALSNLFALGLLGPTEVSPVSEPQSYSLMLLGLVAIIWRFKSISSRF